VWRQREPGLALLVRDRVGRLRQPAVGEAAAGDADLVGQGGDDPEQRAAARRAEVSFLVMMLRSVMEGVDRGLTLLRHDGVPVEVRGDAERAAGSALAVRAVTDAVHRRLRIDGDRCLAAGAEGGSGHNGSQRVRRLPFE
jgi:hypothetical protein